MSPRSPVSDGEIVSEDEEKAIYTTTHARNSKVNGSTRLSKEASSRASHLDALSKDPSYHFRDDSPVRKPRARDRSDSRSPYRADRDRSRSPYRAGKPVSGEKRRREDDHQKGPDTRRFKVHYENAAPSQRGRGFRSGIGYNDPDRSAPPRGHLSYEDRDSRGRGGSHQSHRDRDRSRSPYRANKDSRALEHRDRRQSHFSADSQDGSQGLHGHGQALHTRPGNDERGRRGSTVSIQDGESSTQPPPESEAKIKVSLHQQSKSKSDGEKAKRYVHFEEIVTFIADGCTTSHAPVQVAHATDAAFEKDGRPLSEAEIIEQRRKRREAIKAKHKAPQPLLVQALEHNTTSAPPTPQHESSGQTSEVQSRKSQLSNQQAQANELQTAPSSMDSPATPHRDSPPDSPAAFEITDDAQLANTHRNDGAVNDEGPSAADYDPNLDMQEDRPDHKRQNVEDDAVTGMGVQQSVEELAVVEKPNKEFDMFADDEDDDMFAEESTAKPRGATKVRALDQSLQDNWDYPDGHYRIILGELLDGRYAVQQQIGKGTFATVVRAQDTKTGNAIAIKIACNNETMYKAGTKEQDMLQLLNQQDPEDKKHIIRLLRQFDHKGHMCLVFENLNADLREILKKFGRNIGINIKAIRSYAQQMFFALSHLKKCQILHADLKPDNILVSEKRNLVKICDLGTATFADDAEVTPYLVSRFYRAPEVILGMPFDYAIDMWSIGCTLFELYTGRILFAGADNNQMLRVIQECRGKFPIRMLKKSDLVDRHFDGEGNFFSQERDKITGKQSIRQINFNKLDPAKGLKARLSVNVKGMRPEELREHNAFVDLMDRCLQLDPARRISPSDALRHAFVAHHADGAVKEKKVVPAMRLK